MNSEAGARKSKGYVTDTPMRQNRGAPMGMTFKGRPADPERDTRSDMRIREILITPSYDRSPETPRKECNNTVDSVA